MAGKKRSSSRPGAAPAPKKPKLTTPRSGPKAKSVKKKLENSSRGIPVDDKEETFPRGGKELLTPLEKSVLKSKAKQDSLFAEEEGGTELGDASNSDEEEELTSKASGKSGAGKTKMKRVEVLNQKRLVPGMLILGAVLEVQEYLVVFSLPFNMKGTLAISDISEHLTQQAESEAHRLDESQDTDCSVPLMERLFAVGQLLPCYVQAVSKGRISLSVNPQLINSHLSAKDIKPNLLLPGCITSVEDHGYIVDFSVGDKTGFLLKKNTSEFLKTGFKGRSLCVGQVLHCVVLSGPDVRAVPVSVNPSQVAAAMMSASHLVGVGSLLPGLLVKASVKEVASNGLVLSFLDGFSGMVPTHHLPSPHSSAPLEKLQPNKKLKARLLWVDVAVKKVGLTLRPQLVEGRSYEFEGIEIGDVYEAATVLPIDHSPGLYFDLSDSAENTLVGYAPPWMISDEKQGPDSVPFRQRKQYRRGTQHKVRVCQFNKIDGLVIVSLQQSVLEKPYLKYSDVSVGDRVKGVIEKVSAFGLLVSVTENIRGLCPRNHVSDMKSIVSKPGKKYKEGAEVKCRVLNVDATRKRLLLTCKKSLLRDSAPLADYGAAKPGDSCTGVVTSIHAYGVIVHFFGQVKGLVRKSDLGLGAKASGDLTQLFWVGQPVECRVLECEVSTRRLLLSLGHAPSGGGDNGVGEDVLKSGELVKGEVTGIASNGITLRHPRGGEVMFLPTLHLSDYPQHCTVLLSCHQRKLEQALKQNQPYTLTNLLVVCGKLSYKPALVTLKNLLTTHSKETGYIDTITDFKEGVVQPGYVRNVQPYGCFVDFLHQLSGLAHVKFLTDQFVSQAAGVYQETQTVWAKVKAVDEDGKVSLTLRPSDLKHADINTEKASQAILTSFGTYIAERDLIVQEMKHKEPTSTVRSLSALAAMFVPGGRVSGHVTSVMDDVAMVGLDGVIGKIMKASLHGDPLVKGSHVDCSILDIDLVECCLILSRNSILAPAPSTPSSLPSPLKPSKKGRGKKPKMPVVAEVGLSPGSSLVGVVEHKCAYYLLLSCPTLAGHKLAYGLMDTGQLGVLPLSFHLLRVGQRVTATVLSWSSECGGLPLVKVTGVHSTSGQFPPTRGSSAGEVVTEKKQASPHTSKLYQRGQEVDAVVYQVSDKGLSVHLPEARGFVPIMSVSKDLEVLKNLKEHYKSGTMVKGVVTGKGRFGIYNLSLIGLVPPPEEGHVTTAHMLHILPGRGVMVVTPHGVGLVDITDISDDYQDNPYQVIEDTGNFMECCVVRVDKDKLDFSLRESRVRGDEEVRDPEISDLGGLADGQIVRGYVKSITNVGVFVRLGRNIDGRVQITHLADGFVKDFKGIYSEGDLVTAKVLNVDRVKGKVELSLRLSQVDPQAAKKLRRKLSKKGSSKSQPKLSSDGEENIAEEINTSSDEEEGMERDSDTSSDSEGEEGEEEEEEGAGDEDTRQVTSRRALSLGGGGFKWDVGVSGGVASTGADNDDSENEESENVEATTSKKTRRQKKAAKKAEEVELYQKEQSLLEVGKGAESAQDFDRLLLATPNDSSLWVQYMAFYLHTAEVDKARAVAQRALRTISFREQEEKLNVWVAWMNLENLYGSQELLLKVFDSALEQNEPAKVYKKLVTIYVQSEKHDLADKLYQTMTKKFAGDLWVWSEYGTFLMRQRRHGQARALLQRALKTLTLKQDHVSLISKFAQLEFRHGEPERGRTMFESLLSSYPKRVDLWSVYVDVVLKTGDAQRVREIFERAINLKVSAKKLKFLFKRYVEFEKSHGNQTLMAAVMEKARQYTMT